MKPIPKCPEWAEESLVAYGRARLQRWALSDKGIYDSEELVSFKWVCDRSLTLMHDLELDE